jgi:hypothetical protein
VGVRYECCWRKGVRPVWYLVRKEEHGCGQAASAHSLHMWGEGEGQRFVSACTRRRETGFACTIIAGSITSSVSSIYLALPDRTRKLTSRIQQTDAHSDTRLLRSRYPGLLWHLFSFCYNCLRPWFDSRQGHIFSSLPVLSDPHSLLFSRNRGPEHGADHSPPPCAKIKNAWNHTSTPPHVLKASCTGTRPVSTYRAGANFSLRTDQHDQANLTLETLSAVY